MSGRAEKSRLTYLDLTRIIAIVMVLYNHRFTYLGAPDWISASASHLLLQSLATLCRCGVPLFFAVSGVLLLRKEESFATLLKHRVLRIVIVIALCTLIRANGDFTPANLADVFMTKLNWFLWAYLGYLLMLPFLRKIALHTPFEQAGIYLLLVFFFYTGNGILQALGIYHGLLDFIPLFNSQFGSLCWAIIFSLAGFWLHRDMKQFKPWLLRLLLPASLLSLALSVFFVDRDFHFTGGANQEVLRVHFIYAPTLLLFCLIQLSCRHFPLFQKKTVLRFLSEFSSAIFGIFILETHSPLINWTSSLARQLLSGGAQEYAIAWLAILLQLAVCFMIVSLLRLIPPVKKIL